MPFFLLPFPQIDCPPGDVSGCSPRRFSVLWVARDASQNTYFFLSSIMETRQVSASERRARFPVLCTPKSIEHENHHNSGTSSSSSSEYYLRALSASYSQYNSLSLGAGCLDPCLHSHSLTLLLSRLLVIIVGCHTCACGACGVHPIATHG